MQGVFLLLMKRMPRSDAWLDTENGILREKKDNENIRLGRLGTASVTSERREGNYINARLLFDINCKCSWLGNKFLAGNNDVTQQATLFWVLTILDSVYNFSQWGKASQSLIF